MLYKTAGILGALKRGIKAAIGSPLEFTEMSALQKKDQIERIEGAVKKYKTKAESLDKELKETKKKAAGSLFKGLAGGTVLGIGGTIGTQEYLKNKKRKELERRRLLREAIKTGNPQLLKGLN